MQSDQSDTPRAWQTELRPVGAQILVDGRTVLADQSSVSVYSLLKTLTDRALLLERDRPDLAGAHRIELVVWELPPSRKSYNDAGYYERRRALQAKLEFYGIATCRMLSDALGWKSSETRAKLGSLRADGLASYDGRVWRAEYGGRVWRAES